MFREWLVGPGRGAPHSRGVAKNWMWPDQERALTVCSMLGEMSPVPPSGPAPRRGHHTLAPGLILALSLAGVRAQGLEEGAIAFRQACLDATTDALVLNVAAHPDDEADRTLVWLRHKLGVRTVTLYSTCGSGGQNAIGREIGPDLARLRVRETLAAARHTGVEVRWLGFSDFGYSKTMNETFSRWGGEDEFVRRVSVVLDDHDPDVVFTNHAPDRGHGHHRASAVGVREALSWRAREVRAVPLYERMFVTVRRPPDWQCDPFEFDAVRGVTFARQASRGRHQHQTQGPWSPHDPTRQSRERWRMALPGADAAVTEPTRHFGSVLEVAAFRQAWSGLGQDVESLRRDLAGFGGSRTVAEHVAVARALLPDLRRAGAMLGDDAGARDARRRLARRIDALERVVLCGSGVQIEAFLENPRLVRGERGVARVLVHAAEGLEVTDVQVSCRGAVGVAVSERGQGARMLRVEFDPGPGRTGSRGDEEPAAWPFVPFEPEWVEVAVQLSVDGLPFEVGRRLAADVEAPLSVDWGRRAAFISAAGVSRVLPLHLRYQGAGEFEGEVTLSPSGGVTATATPSIVRLSAERPMARVLVHLESAPGAVAERSRLRARIGAAAAELLLVPAPVDLDPALRVGLVRGPDDTLQRALEDLGVVFEVLDEARLAATDLGEFSVLVLDIRAYHHRPDLADHRDRMLEFCAAGGRVLSFYHKQREWNEADGRPLLSPYALEIGAGRVAEEDAAVTLLQPEHGLWNRPHHITGRDFDGWVQERGLNFPVKWGDAWVPMIEMGDTREKPLTSGLLYARHGDGDYVYCSLALYRQLRVSHLGAARILVNLLTR